MIKNNLITGFIFLFIFMLFSGCTSKSSNDEEEINDKDHTPKITITEPVDESNIFIGTTVIVNTTVTCEVKINYVRFYLNNEEQFYTENTPYTFSWNTKDEEIKLGNYSIKVEAESIDGKISSKTIVIHLVEPTYKTNITGIVKDRSNNSILNNLNISFNGTTTATNNEGVYSFDEVNMEERFYSIKIEGNNSYIPSRFGFDVIDNIDQNIDLYLYKKSESVNKKSTDFIKGVSLFDAGPWMVQDLYPNEFDATFERLKSINSNLVTVFDPAFITVAGYDSVKMNTTANTSYQWDMLNTSQYQTLTDKATVKGLEFMWWFGVWPHDEKKLNDKSFNDIVFGSSKLSDAFWDDWFNEYTKILKEYAIAAENKNVKYISLGHGLNYATSAYKFSSEQLYNKLWTKMINEIKSVYSGKIIYFGTCRNFNAINYGGSVEVEYYEHEGYSDEFKSLFDAFGIILSCITPEENPGIQDVKSATTNILNKFTSFGKPIILWIWSSSVDGAANRYGHLEPVIDVHNISENFTQDYYEQSDIYEGIMQSVNETSVDVLGVISHGYMYYDRLGIYENRNMRTSFEKAASVRGKPAEDILGYWYGNW